MLRIRLSPSRVELFLMCPARWAFSELQGFREPDTEATTFGTAVHLEHELYYGPANRPYRTHTREGLLAWHMASKYPARADFVSWNGTVETELTHTVDGYTLEGRADMLWLRAGVAHVGDHKTTSNMRYAKLERADLFGHSQAPFYLLAACEHFGVGVAQSQWVYATTTEKPARLAVSAHAIGIDEARDRTYTRMLPVVREMVAARDAGMTGERMPKNLLACKKYNRWCPHLARCQPNRYGADMSSFLAALAKAEEPATPVAPPAPSGGLFSSISGGVAAPPANPADPTAGAAVNPPEGEGKGKGRGRKAAGEKGGATISDADADLIAHRVVDLLATRLMSGVR